MSWTAIWTDHGPLLDRTESAEDMAVATFLLEGRAPAPAANAPGLWRGTGPGALRIDHGADGALDIAHGAAALRTAPGFLRPGEAFRLTLRTGAGDAPGTVELARLDRGGTMHLPAPNRHGGLRAIDFRPPGDFVPGSAGLAALANHDAAPAEGPGLETGTAVATAAGAVPVERLRPGDIVLTENSPAMVTRVARREAVTLGAMNAVRLRAPFFGLKRDVLVARHTEVLLSGPEVEYVFGEEMVSAEAGDLVDGGAIRRDLSAPLRDFVSVELDRPGALRVGRARIAAGPGAAPCERVDRTGARSLLAACRDPRALIG